MGGWHGPLVGVSRAFSRFSSRGRQQGEALPGSPKSYTQGQVDDIYNPPDWYPEEHAPFPKVVANGEGKATPGCASCHLASGSGHPESANLTGLTADYITTQLHDFQQGLRTDPRHRMSEIAKGMTEEDVKEAAAYFSARSRACGSESWKPTMYPKLI